jgi:hypothetical protein
MDAVPVLDRKQHVAGGYIIEIVIWSVPQPVPGSRHSYKYRLFFGRPGHRIVGYDNERGKGDHKHLEGTELAYEFRDLDTLLADFAADVSAWRAKR